MLFGVVVYTFGAFLRRLVLPLAIQSWSLTSLQLRLFKTGRRLIRHALSLYPPTEGLHVHIPIHTAGGEALTCSDKNLKEPFDLLKNFGTKDEDEVVTPGINGKMSEL